MADLACFGGPPCFAEPVHVGRPNVGDRGRLLARFNDLLDRRWFSNRGPYVQEFELQLAKLLGVRHCITVANGTIALEIAARALGLSGEVITPSFTFVATAGLISTHTTFTQPGNMLPVAMECSIEPMHKTRPAPLSCSA